MLSCVKAFTVTKQARLHRDWITLLLQKGHWFFFPIQTLLLLSGLSKFTSILDISNIWKYQITLFLFTENYILVQYKSNRCLNHSWNFDFCPTDFIADFTSHTIHQTSIWQPRHYIICLTSLTSSWCAFIVNPEQIPHVFLKLAVQLNDEEKKRIVKVDLQFLF